MTREELEVIANEYLQNDISMKDLAIKYHMSKSTSGNLGNFALSKDEIITVTKAYVDSDDLNLRSVAENKNVSAAAIYNNFTRENLVDDLYEQVTQKYNANYSGRVKTGL